MNEVQIISNVMDGVDNLENLLFSLELRVRLSLTFEEKTVT